MEKPIARRKINYLLNNLNSYYEKSRSIPKHFGGPSIYFHRQCIKECNNKKTFLSDRHIELIYATLASWGMHRMGNPKKMKTKLKVFSEFRKSIKAQEEKLWRLRKYDITKIGDNQLEKIINNEVKDIFFKLIVSEANSKLIAHAKTIHHLLPKLVPPMDHTYTMGFFSKSVPKNEEKQYELFSKIIVEMHFLAKELAKRKKFSKLRNLKKDGDFNTSYTKIIDNLIISWVKSHPQKSSSRH